MLNEITTMSMLYDFYGNLLPERQKEFCGFTGKKTFRFQKLRKNSA